MVGNGVNFQGSLQAFMDSFVLNSMKKEKEMRDSQLHGQHFSLENTEHKIKRANDGNQEESTGDAKPAGGGRSQYEPLDLSVRPDAGTLPGASVTIQDNVAWHGCLFCSFTTASVELMALHLQANHLGKAKQGQGKETKEHLLGESSLSGKVAGLVPPGLLHLHESPSSREREAESGELKNQASWSNHLEQNPHGASMGNFSNDFYKPFGPLYDGSSRGPSGFLDQQTNQSSDMGGQDELSDKASCGDMEASEERGGQSDDDEAGREETSSNPTGTERQSRSDDDEPEAEEEEDMEVGDMEDEDCGAIRMHPESPLSAKDAQRAKMSMGAQGPGPTSTQPPALEKQWQQQQQQQQAGLGLLSTSTGPPGLLKPEQAHLEHQMNMLSVLRAYSSENLSAFNGGLTSNSNAGGGGSSSSMKRPDPSVHLWAEDEASRRFGPALASEPNLTDSEMQDAPLIRD